MQARQSDRKREGMEKREFEGEREIKSINMWVAHATHSSVCSTRNNLRRGREKERERKRGNSPSFFIGPSLYCGKTACTIIVSSHKIDESVSKSKTFLIQQKYSLMLKVWIMWNFGK